MYFDARRWLDHCMQMIEQVFGYDRVSYDGQSFSWVMVEGFPLSDWWLQSHTNLLILLPPIGNIQMYPPEHFYLDKGLRTASGLVPEHYYEDGRGYNDMADQGWARYSLEIESWHPASDVISGDNLLTLLELVYVSLDRLAQETEGVR